LEHQIQLGKLLVEQGKHKEAEQLLREALKMSRATLGDWHPRSLKCINPLGSVLQTQGKYKEAEVLYREALKVCQKTASDRHLHTKHTLEATAIVYAATTTSLGTLLKNQGKFQEAASVLREGLEACRATFGSRNKCTLDAAKSLGTVLQDQGKLENAEVLLREVLEGTRAMFGHRHMFTRLDHVKLVQEHCLKVIRLRRRQPHPQRRRRGALSFLRRQSAEHLPEHPCTTKWHRVPPWREDEACVPDRSRRELEDDVPVARPLCCAHVTNPVLVLRKDVEPNVMALVLLLWQR
jgi:hypothetical protein